MAVAHQDLQQSQRGTRQANGLAGSLHPHRGEIENQIADVQALGSGWKCAAAARERRQTRLQFGERKGLDQVVVRPHLKTCKLVLKLIPRGEHEHRDVAAALRAQPRAQLHSIHPRQAEVKHDRVMFS